jgi:hypothetical protein
MYVTQEGEVDILLHEKVVETVEPVAFWEYAIDNRPARQPLSPTDCTSD